MVNVSQKQLTHRLALARGSIEMDRETLVLINTGGSKKGDVLGVARIAGIQAAKKTSDLIPLCHPLMLTRVAVDFQFSEKTHSGLGEIICISTVENIGPTGVEMEALMAVQVALLTIFDMCKAIDPRMSIERVHVLEKRGGKSGVFLRDSLEGNAN